MHLAGFITRTSIWHFEHHTAWQVYLSKE